MKTIQIKVNGAEHTVTAEPDTPLLYILRNNLKLNGPKFGCGLGQCGTCMVLFNGTAVASCQVRVNEANDAEIITLDGLPDKDGKLHKVQEAFIVEQAAQCGYCLNGLIISSVSLLNENGTPSDDEIRNKLQVNICRCGIHSRVIRAVRKAANI